jgi:hypothetical protein
MSRKRAREAEEGKDKECSKCSRVLPLLSFRKDRSYCKDCHNKRRRERRATANIDHRCALLLEDCKRSAKRRGAKDDSRGKISLTTKSIRNMWTQQNSQCEISGHDMNSCGEDWVASVDRRDNSLGYDLNNVRLVCREFNYAQHKISSKKKENLAQPWTSEKFNQVKTLMNAPLSDEQKKMYNKNIEEAREYLQKECRKFEPLEAVSKKNALLITSAQCTSCGQMKSPKEFTSSELWHKLHTHCHQCACRRIREHYYGTFEKKLQSRSFEPMIAVSERNPEKIILASCFTCQQMLPKENFSKYSMMWHNLQSDCKDCSLEKRECLKASIIKFQSSIKKVTTPRRKIKRAKFKNNELTFKQLLDLYIRQNGRCYYSNIFMSFKTRGDWQISKERIDPNIGYTEENTVFACIEFQTRAQWSKQKFNEIFRPEIQNGVS